MNSPLNERHLEIVSKIHENVGGEKDGDGWGWKGEGHASDALLLRDSSAWSSLLGEDNTEWVDDECRLNSYEEEMENSHITFIPLFYPLSKGTPPIEKIDFFRGHF